MNQNESFTYTETEVLENLKEAINYNRALVQLTTHAEPLLQGAQTLDFGAGLATSFAGKGL